jgi:hypothetical protein
VTCAQGPAGLKLEVVEAEVIQGLERG